MVKTFWLESVCVSFSYEICGGATTCGRLGSVCGGGKEAAAADAYFIGNGAAGTASRSDLTTGAVVPGFGGRGAIFGGALCFISSFLEMELVEELSLTFEGEVDCNNFKW